MAFELKGKVKTGTGRGAKFIALPIYEQIFEKHLGKKPYPGTLNLKVNEDDCNKIDEFFSQSETVYKDLTYEGKEYGGIVLIKVTILCSYGKNDKIEAVGVRPFLTSHKSDIIEIVSDFHLRECLNLKDNDEVAFSISQL